MPINVEFRGGPRNAEIETFADGVAFPDIEMNYVDANLQGSKPLERTGHYVYDAATYRYAWHVDHAKGAGRPIEVETPESDLDVTDHERPRVGRPARRA